MPYLTELAEIYEVPLTEADLTDERRTLTVKVSDIEQSLLATINEYIKTFTQMSARGAQANTPKDFARQVAATKDWMETHWDNSSDLMECIKELPLNVYSAATIAKRFPELVLPPDVENKLRDGAQIQWVIVKDNRGQSDLSTQRLDANRLRTQLSAALD